MQKTYQGNIYLYSGNQMLQMQQLVGDIYWKFKDKEDGFLYLSYSNKNPMDAYLALFNTKNLFLLIIFILVFYLIFFLF